MKLRPYQDRCLSGVSDGWRAGFRRQLGVAATGAGKTIVFSHLAANEPGRTLILAHREELVSQAVQKLHSATGIFASVEQGEQRALPGHGVIVGSVQSVRRRLAKYRPDAFDLVICDEAHHSLSAEWQTVLAHFAPARILGVTATPDRSDRKSLGKFYENVAFEVGLLELIGEGYLCPLRSLRLDVKLDARHLRVVRGDIRADDAADVISPRLRELARCIAAEIWDKKALIFLPRCDVSANLALALFAEGIDARHVAGDSEDRDSTLAWFRSAPHGSALCNAMLLTEGYDQPDIDCVVCLRPTKSRSLYAQIVGRGTRTSPGKEFCLLLDPLWLTGGMDLCKPCDLTATTPLHREALQAHLDAGADILAAEKLAAVDVEEALAKQLNEAKKRKAPKGMVDPLAYAVGIHDSDLSEYEPAMPWEEMPPTDEQTRALTAAGLWTEQVTQGYAIRLLKRLEERKALGLATPKQVVKLRQFGEVNADLLTVGQAGAILGKRLNGRWS